LAATTIAVNSDWSEVKSKDFCLTFMLGDGLQEKINQLFLPKSATYKIELV
jgi:hypothetical protein